MVGHASRRLRARSAAVAWVLLLGALAGCGGEAAEAVAGDASPAADVSTSDGAATAAVTTPDDTAERTGTAGTTGGPVGAAEAYAAFAAGGDGSAVPFASRVTYRIGGADVATLTAREAARPGAWRACPVGETTYEGRECPVTPLRSLALLAADGAPAQVEAGWPGTVGCTRVAPAEAVEGASAVSLRPPPQRRDCFSDVGVLLRVDAGGRIDLVELVLSGS